MAEYNIEVYRQEVDDLTGKLLAIALAETEHMAQVDRGLVVSAALANVACLIDGSEHGIVYCEDGATGRLARMADGWRRGGG